MFERVHIQTRQPKSSLFLSKVWFEQLCIYIFQNNMVILENYDIYLDRISYRHSLYSRLLDNKIHLNVIHSFRLCSHYFHSNHLLSNSLWIIRFIQVSKWRINNKLRYLSISIWTCRICRARERHTRESCMEWRRCSSIFISNRSNSTFRM